MKRIRIAYLPAALRPGGAERQMVSLAERLPRDEFEIDFLVLSGEGPDEPRARAAGVTIRRVGGPPPLTASIPSRLGRRLAKTYRFLELARAGRYDIIDAWLYPADVLAAFAGPFSRRPVIVTGRRNLDPRDAFGPAGHLVDRIAMRLTDAVVANSAAAAAHAIASEPVLPAKVRVIRNGVAPAPPMTAADQKRIRAELGAPEGHDLLLVGCLANYLPVKAHDALIDAFAVVVRSVPAARLYLMGEGPMRDAMERQVASLGLSDRIRLLGSVSQPRALLGGFDVMVQASRREGLPNALLESAAAGRPIVATAAGGSPEIVIDGDTGILVPIGDENALAAGLIRLLADPDLRLRLGQSAQAHVLNVFGMDRFAAEFAGLYRELVARRAR
jgi:glycosyltransferase involved in cell wall biosynthesis